MMVSKAAVFDETMVADEDIDYQTWIVKGDTIALQTNDTYTLPGADLEQQSRFGAAGLAALRRNFSKPRPHYSH